MGTCYVTSPYGLLADPVDAPERAARLTTCAVETAAGERLQVPALVPPSAVVARAVDEKSMTMYLALLRRAIELDLESRGALPPTRAESRQTSRFAGK